MARAVGCFRRVGWSVLPFPVDYNTEPNVGFFLKFNLVAGLKLLGLAVHEWIGLIAYRALGRTESLFPAPRAAADKSTKSGFRPTVAVGSKTALASWTGGDLVS